MAVAPTYPGVYIEEVPSGVHTITGVATSITAFVGFTTDGPVDPAVHIFSFGDFERACGGLTLDSPLSHAVHDFFQNGGTEAYIVRSHGKRRRSGLDDELDTAGTRCSRSRPPARASGATTCGSTSTTTREPRTPVQP